MWFDYVVLEDGRVIYWPICKTTGCSNRMNMDAGNGLCWPCQPSGKTFEQVMETVGSSETVSGDHG